MSICHILLKKIRNKLTSLYFLNFGAAGFIWPFSLHINLIFIYLEDIYNPNSWQLKLTFSNCDQSSCSIHCWIHLYPYNMLLQRRMKELYPFELWVNVHPGRERSDSDLMKLITLQFFQSAWILVLFCPSLMPPLKPSFGKIPPFKKPLCLLLIFKG